MYFTEQSQKANSFTKELEENLLIIKVVTQRKMEDTLARSSKIENYIIILIIKTKFKKDKNKNIKRSCRKCINYKNILNI